jgi:single-stranded-DNA-specific exonuclease
MELNEVIKKVEPRKVFLFGVNPGMDDPKAFLRRLVGLVKSKVKTSSGIISLSALAGATSQRIQTVKSGLEWLEDHGHLRLETIDQDTVKITLEKKNKQEDTKTSSTRLYAMLTESAAFRRYYLSTSKERLLSNEYEA